MIVKPHDVSRRGLLRIASAAGFFAGLPAIAFAAPVEPLAAGATRFRSLSIDTQPLADAGLSNYAIRISKMAEPILASVFADRLAPASSESPRLVLRINSITLSHDSGVGRSPFNIVDRDWISGAGEIVDARGKVLRVEPVDTSTVAFSQSGDILSAENIRTQRLITILAEWVDRYV